MYVSIFSNNKFSKINVLNIYSFLVALQNVIRIMDPSSQSSHCCIAYLIQDIGDLGDIEQLCSLRFGLR